jgi:glycosyltransferase involved in cell wall biosynthesis
MKIAIDVSPINNANKNRGVGTYTLNLLNELKTNPELYIQEFNNLTEVKNADIIHFPYFDLFKHTLVVHETIPTVVTIHDVVPLIYPKAYPAGVRGKINFYRQRNKLKKIAAIITDSRASKEDIARFLKIEDKKIFPVYLAPNDYFYKISDLKTLEYTRNKYNLPQNFILFIGNVNWNKNLLNLSEASIQAGVDLVLVGKSFEEKDNLGHAELKSFKEFLNRYSSNPKIHILGYVESQELVCITNLAMCLLLPSFAEGFGLTILEGQICETPIITSDTSSMPEVAGEGALFVDPHSVESIYKAIKLISDNQEIKQELIIKGLKNVKRFSWQKTAEENIKIYKKITESK